MKLKDVTIICVDTRNHGAAIFALKQCLEKVTPERCLLLSNVDMQIDGIEIIQIPPINSKDEYSTFIVKELYKYFDTKYCLIIQWDGYILDGEAWDDDFYNYDLVAAPWLYIDDRNMGCGGFTLRSHKLQKILGTDEFIQICCPEDEIIGRLYRHYLEENYDIKFASDEVGDAFAFELRTPIQPTFGFHGHFHRPFQKTVVIKRTGAFGDVLQTEALLHYFFKKGYRVVLDTLPQFHNALSQHYFKIHRIDEIDGRLLPNAEMYNLDLAYEANPKQLHLKSYYELCGIPESEMEIRNPKLSLNFPIEGTGKLFKKYVVIHLDERPQNGRNVQGDIDWNKIIKLLKRKGYYVFQIGMGDHEEIEGAIFFNTPNEPLLMWLIGGSDLFVGIDSAPATIATGFDVPAVVFFGNVEPSYIHSDLTNIEVIQYENVCDTPKCWHRTLGCEGMKCAVDETRPPCVQFTTEQVLNAINRFI